MWLGMWAEWVGLVVEWERIDVYEREVQLDRLVLVAVESFGRHDGRSDG